MDKLNDSNSIEIYKFWFWILIRIFFYSDSIEKYSQIKSMRGYNLIKSKLIANGWIITT